MISVVLATIPGAEAFRPAAAESAGRYRTSGGLHTKPRQRSSGRDHPSVTR